MLCEEKLIYSPSRRFSTTPEALGLRHDEVTLVTEDSARERLHAWFLPAGDGGPERRFTVLMCHGNAGNISDRLDRTLLMQVNLGTDVLLFDYRGFGESSGSPTEEGTYEDARAAHRYLVRERGLDARSIVLFGESLGAAVALDLALEVEAAGLVLEAPFTSIRDMAKEVYPFVPISLVRTHYDNLGKIPRLAMPLLVVHGTADPTVPFEQGSRLFDAAPRPKVFLEVEGGGHTDAFVVDRDRYWNAWRDFLLSLSS